MPGHVGWVLLRLMMRDTRLPRCHCCSCTVSSSAPAQTVPAQTTPAVRHDRTCTASLASRRVSALPSVFLGISSRRRCLPGSESAVSDSQPCMHCLSMLMLLSMAEHVDPCRYLSLACHTTTHYHSTPHHTTPYHSTPHHSLSLISRAPSPPAPALARIVPRRRRAIHHSLPMPDVAAHRRPLHRTVSLSRCTSSIPSMPSSPRFPCHHRLDLHAIIALHVIINITRDFTIASSSIRTACPFLETCLVSALRRSPRLVYTYYNCLTGNLIVSKFVSPTFSSLAAITSPSSQS
jgi:hypothetical protein